MDPDPRSLFDVALPFDDQLISRLETPDDLDAVPFDDTDLRAARVGDTVLDDENQPFAAPVNDGEKGDGERIGNDAAQEVEPCDHAGPNLEGRVVHQDFRPKSLGGGIGLEGDEIDAAEELLSRQGIDANLYGLADPEITDIALGHTGDDLDLLDVDDVQQRVAPVDEFTLVDVQMVDASADRRVHETVLVFHPGLIEIRLGTGPLGDAVIELLLRDDPPVEEFAAPVVNAFRQLIGRHGPVQSRLAGRDIDPGQEFPLRNGVSFAEKERLHTPGCIGGDPHVQVRFGFARQIQDVAERGGVYRNDGNRNLRRFAAAGFIGGFLVAASQEKNRPHKEGAEQQQQGCGPGWFRSGIDLMDAIGSPIRK
ncbi:hypothetical protein TRIP_B330185 [uncultured Desulfatiglans sp.]|nr:hypothetical protein TRIP_B330185 [uncultured Desulfatiglans sp.]